jgi:hypothetical protein
MATLGVGKVGQSGGAIGRPSELGGVAALLLGAALVIDVVVFAAYLASTGVNIQADDPATRPVELAQQLVSGAARPFWIWYLVLAALAVFAFVAVQSLSEYVRAAGARLPLQALGSTALAIYIVAAIASAVITRVAGSAVLTQSELIASIPVLFGVLIPVLLATFNLLCAAWILATSWAGWHTSSMPRWLSVIGALTSLVLIAGVTGKSGIEVLAGPWLIATGSWMVFRSRSALVE